jgi:uncharacterized membrane protein
MVDNIVFSPKSTSSTNDLKVLVNDNPRESDEGEFIHDSLRQLKLEEPVYISIGDFKGSKTLPKFGQFKPQIKRRQKSFFISHAFDPKDPHYEVKAKILVNYYLQRFKARDDHLIFHNFFSLPKGDVPELYMDTINKANSDSEMVVIMSDIYFKRSWCFLEYLYARNYFRICMGSSLSNIETKYINCVTGPSSNQSKNDLKCKEMIDRLIKNYLHLSIHMSVLQLFIAATLDIPFNTRKTGVIAAIVSINNICAALMSPTPWVKRYGLISSLAIISLNIYIATLNSPLDIKKYMSWILFMTSALSICVEMNYFIFKINPIILINSSTIISNIIMGWMRNDMDTALLTSLVLLLGNLLVWNRASHELRMDHFNDE